jgi:hypothetical protein
VTRRHAEFLSLERETQPVESREASESVSEFRARMALLRACFLERLTDMKRQRYILDVLQNLC